MKTNKLNILSSILLLSILLFSLGFVSATEQTLGTFKQNSCVNLIQICSNCTFNNISSVLYPTSIQAIGQVVMTKIGTSYNYSFCKANQTGTYNVNGFGDLDGTNTIWSYTFDITPTGQVQNSTYTWLVILIALGIIVLGFVFKDFTIIRFGAIATILVGLYTIIFGISGIKDTVYTWGIGIILVGLASYIFIKASWEAIEE